MHVRVYMCVCVCVCVCVFVCSGITLERLEQFRPNLVHTLLYVCVRILCIYILYIYIISPKHHFQQGGWCGRPPCYAPLQGLPVAAAVTFTQIGIEATAR
jgi:hypothetical protein